MAVAKIQSRNDLTKESASLFRRQPTFFHQVIEELATRNVFQDQITDPKKEKKRYVYI